MLVLRRLPGDSILIDGHIRITVLSVRGPRVQLGIEAEASVSIVRAELSPQAAEEPLPAVPPHLERIDLA